MDQQDDLASRFEQERPRLRAVAYRMLGSMSDAEDAVQEAWIRLHRHDAEAIDNLAGWLTTVVTRISLNTLRSRETRREVHLPDPVIGPAGAADPAEEALLGDAVSLALLVVLDTLAPAERVALVLHDIFGLAFDDIAAVLDCSNAAARKHASRARRRIQATPTPSGRPGDQRKVVDAFFAAARTGDLTRLVALLHPQVVLRSDIGPGRLAAVEGAAVVAGRAAGFASPHRRVHPVTVNGAAGAVISEHGHLVSVMRFTVTDGRIAVIDVLADPDRLRGLPIDLVRLGRVSDDRTAG